MATTSYTHQQTYRGVDLEVDCTVTYTVTPGEKEIRYGDNACPGCGPEVDIESVKVDATGEDILDEADTDAITESILGNYDEDDDGDPDDYDRARDLAMERD